MSRTFSPGRYIFRILFELLTLPCLSSSYSKVSWPHLRYFLQKKKKISEFHCVSLALLANSGAQSSFLVRFLLLPMIRSVLANMHEMEKLLQKTDDINWTVVRPPGLKNLPASGRIRRAGCICQALCYVTNEIKLPFCLESLFKVQKAASGLPENMREKKQREKKSQLNRIQFYRHGCWCVTFSVLLRYFLGRLYPTSWSKQGDPSFN